MTDIKSSTYKISSESAKKGLTLAAQGLIAQWLRKESLDIALKNPGAEDLIIAAAIEISTSELRTKWLKKVRGNCKDPRRIALAKKCEKAINDRYR